MDPDIEGLKCLFCKRRCGKVDALWWDGGDFKLQWRPGGPYASCKACMFRVCAYERQVYLKPHQGVCARELVRRTGKPLSDIRVRCETCGKLLTNDEKDWLKLNGRCVFLVRQRWRANCYSCHIDNEGAGIHHS
ncbi:E6 [Equus caballus papillomavirus 9]|uniref:Protein E6 n=1 Tax=Equus caballus papillomavirus 9 TaxID=2601244 RepID=A0A5B8KHC7_9PAPI|nr:E6 [Equus caballus papillomavirus 9]UXP87511.1 E6 protein [Equus caballus papillomavirus 9]UXP87518.1 E6 protein [Equus caballus papillomavirus 9]